jgi:hypothetical protein
VTAGQGVFVTQCSTCQSAADGRSAAEEAGGEAAAGTLF